MGEWKITRRGGICTACERSFEDSERLVSTLRIGPEGLERAEFCRAWWSATPQDARGEACAEACSARAEGAELPPGVEDLIWWATRHHAEARKTVQLDLASLERLFLELEGREELKLRELRYLLCLLLMRKRRVKVEKIERGAEGESFVVRRPRHEERYRVFVFDFEPERIEELRAELQSIFDGAEALDGGSVDGEDPGEQDPSEGDPTPDGALVTDDETA